MNTSSLHVLPRAELAGVLSVQLKQDTKTDHQALEAVPALQRLMGDSLNLVEYAELMAVWYACWYPLEVALQAALQAGGSAAEWADLLPAPRRFALADDLRVLGAGLPQPLPLGHLGGMPEMTGYRWLGAAYVLKGAQLGNAVIAQRLHRQLGLSLGAGPCTGLGLGQGVAGASFFQFQRQDEPSLLSDWKRWCGKLDSLKVSGAQRALAVQAGQQTFQFLRQHLSVVT